MDRYQVEETFQIVAEDDRTFTVEGRRTIITMNTAMGRREFLDKRVEFVTVEGHGVKALEDGTFEIEDLENLAARRL